MNCPKCNGPSPLLTHICHCRWDAMAKTERKPVIVNSYWREALAACASTNS